MTTTETIIADVIRVRPDLAPSEVGAVMQAEPGLSVEEIIAILDESATDAQAELGITRTEIIQAECLHCGRVSERTVPLDEGSDTQTATDGCARCGRQAVRSLGGDEE